MASYFADSSAIFKLYFREIGSEWVRSLDLSSLSISALAVPEGASVIARRQREGLLLSRDALFTWRHFRRDVRRWLVIDLTQSLLNRSGALLIRSATAAPLRALDGIQLACALEAERRAQRGGIGPLTFLTADSRLELAASSAGLEVDNPERHAV